MLREKFMQLKPSEASDLLINAGLAYLGLVSFKPQTAPHFISSALWGPVSLKLAQGESEAAGIVGSAGLLTLGVVESLNVLGRDAADVLAETGPGGDFEPVWCEVPGIGNIRVPRKTCPAGQVRGAA